MYGRGLASLSRLGRIQLAAFLFGSFSIFWLLYHIPPEMMRNFPHAVDAYVKDQNTRYAGKAMRQR